MTLKSVVGCIVVLCFAALPASAGHKKPPAPSTAPLDQFVREAEARSAQAGPASPGSLWLPTSHITDLAADVRASQVDDLLTIVVSEQASAVATGTTQTQRASSTQNSVGALAGFVGKAGRLANLANVSGNTQLNGQGTTSRTTTIATTLSARVCMSCPTAHWW